MDSIFNLSKKGQGLHRFGFVEKTHGFSKLFLENSHSPLIGRFMCLNEKLKPMRHGWECLSPQKPNFIERPTEPRPEESVRIHGGTNLLMEEHGNFGFQRWDPVPVTANPAGDSDFGVAQLVGNGWEWTSTVFSPFEGFTPYPTYPGYSSRFFDQDHYVVKGAGPQTAVCLLRRSFRNWFRPSYPHAHAGFRCVQNGS